ncbi:coiled-coil domain-containing protein 84 isoform X2 [Athene cunicularia]|uniref:coiled-coil domain-containing protein 84 isoform X2 n=1 Tax=Athene cunicularia TaxID=194338 RepID=UPI000EF71B60|nr:coiled-coil domain-containing protein 84 isoform X2 [Athene cunicularia]
MFTQYLTRGENTPVTMNSWCCCCVECMVWGVNCHCLNRGAKPPWLMEEEEGSKPQIGPSYEEFLKQKEKQKLKKLPAERVGANFDHTSQTGDNWLPSFGRVWNHGRRWQSRHQFRTESGEKKKKR